MDKKKKPPAGATLVSRLKESRLRREQALEEKQKGTSTAEPSARKGVAPLRPSGNQPKTPVVTAGKDTRATPGNFVNRHISMADLRPATNSYQQLTEEIRLAGRFAAAGLIAQGLRLTRLRDDEIYKEHYPTFEDYCRGEHSMSATYAYRLIRMGEMAERLAEDGGKAISHRATEHMPDPFEVMLGLGHRHLLAILPLESTTLEDLLIKGIAVPNEAGTRNKRIPIAKATEQQIREAIRLLLPAAPPAKKSTSRAPAVRSVRTLEDLLEILQQWHDWLESEPDPGLILSKIGDKAQINKLARRLQSNSEKLVESLHSLHKH